MPDCVPLFTALCGSPRCACTERRPFSHWADHEPILVHVNCIAILPHTQENTLSDQGSKMYRGGVNGTERAASIGMLQRWGGRMARVAEGRPGGPAGAAPHWCTRWNTVLRNQNRKQRAMSAPQACLPAATQHSTEGPSRPMRAARPAHLYCVRMPLDRCTMSVCCVSVLPSGDRWKVSSQSPP
jgi:hypothetical protein